MPTRHWTAILFLPLMASAPYAQEPDMTPPEVGGAYRSTGGGLFLVGAASEEAIIVRDLEGGLRGRFDRTASDRFEHDDAIVRVRRDAGGVAGLEVSMAGAAH